MRRRSLAVGALALLLALAAVAAHATWASQAFGTASAAADDLGGNKPSAAVADDDITVAWTPSTFNDGTAAVSYTVRRYSVPGGTAQSVGAGCAGAVVATTCTEQNVAAGTWRYTVTPHYLTWTGSESATSDAVVVVAAVVDGTAPTTAATASPPANGAGWHKADVSVTLSATDPAPGVVKQVTYSATGAQAIASTTVLGSTATVPTITAAGTTTVSFFAQDVAGNVETAKTLVVKLDKVAPTATLHAPAAVRIRNGQALTGTYADATSGMATVAYYSCPAAAATCTTGNGTLIGTSATAPYSLAWNSQPADGSYKVVANAIDTAGSSTLSNTVTVTIDNTAPTVVLTSWAEANGNGNTKVNFSGTGEVGLSVTVVVCSVNVFPCSAADTKGSATAATVAANGTWKTADTDNLGVGTFYAQATQTDLAGNTAVSNILTVSQAS